MSTRRLNSKRVNTIQLLRGFDTYISLNRKLFKVIEKKTHVVNKVWGKAISVYLVVCCDYKKDRRRKKRKCERGELPFTLLLFSSAVYNDVSANDLVHKNEP